MLKWQRERRRKRELIERDRVAKKAFRTAQVLTGISVGGWGCSEEMIADTMTVDEVRSVLIEYAGIKAVRDGERK